MRLVFSTAATESLLSMIVMSFKFARVSAILKVFLVKVFILNIFIGLF